MITVAILLVALALAWFMLAGWRVGALTVFERLYLLLTPLPMVLTFGIPLAMTVLRLGDGGGKRSWSNRLTEGGIWLSGVLVRPAWRSWGGAGCGTRTGKAAWRRGSSWPAFRRS